jgi:PD-(D/E)XK endonuclease
MKLSNRQIGAVGVARVAGALFRNGYSVLTPVEDFSGYDLVAEKGGKFYRIQVKTTSKTEGEKNYYRFMTCGGNQKKCSYSKSKIDYLIAWAMDEDLFWIFKPSECKGPTKKLYPKTGSSWRIVNDL